MENQTLSALRGGLDKATMGLSQPIGAGMAALISKLMGTGLTFDEALRIVQEQHMASQQEHPDAMAAGEVIGLGALMASPFAAARGVEAIPVLSGAAVREYKLRDLNRKRDALLRLKGRKQRTLDDKIEDLFQ